MMDRRIAALSTKLTKLYTAKGGAPDQFSPARFMGPQFRSRRLPSVEATDIVDATDVAFREMEEGLLGRAS